MTTATRGTSHHVAPSTAATGRGLLAWTGVGWAGAAATLWGLDRPERLAAFLLGLVAFIAAGALVARYVEQLREVAPRAHRTVSACRWFAVVAFMLVWGLHVVPVQSAVPLATALLVPAVAFAPLLVVSVGLSRR